MVDIGTSAGYVQEKEEAPTHQKIVGERISVVGEIFYKIEPINNTISDRWQIKQ